jgi:DNA ligase D-like protein (predicted polymerase)
LARKRETEILVVAGREVAISHPDKVLFPKPKYTKLDLVRYYLAVAEGALRGAGGRPNMLVRYPDGIGREHFYQKRAPKSRPAWIEVVELRFPSGRAADEVVPRDAAALAWLANLACLELHPHPVRAEDLEHPDELRIDLDPVPGIEWTQVQEVTSVSRAVLHDFNLTGWPKTSGSRGMHICVRLERRWAFDDVRRAALALAREVEQRVPNLATSKWWKEERHGVFVDYNQNAKDRTVASAYSVRPTPDARVSAPLSWDEVGECEPADFTLASMPARYDRLETRMRRSTSTPARSRACSSFSSVRAWATRPGRRITETGCGASASPAIQAQTRRPKHPLIEIGRARRKEDALAGLTRWKRRHPQAAAHLEPADVLIDAMRGRYSTWTRIRVNLQHVPEELRPNQEPLDPDEKILSSS